MARGASVSHGMPAPTRGRGKRDVLTRRGLAHRPSRRSQRLWSGLEPHLRESRQAHPGPSGKPSRVWASGGVGGRRGGRNFRPAVHRSHSTPRSSSSAWSSSTSADSRCSDQLQPFSATAAPFLPPFLGLAAAARAAFGSASAASFSASRTSHDWRKAARRSS